MRQLIGTIITVCLFTNCFGQEFRKIIDEERGLSSIRFQDLRTPVRIPILIEKKFPSAMPDSVSYHIGLYLFINLVPLDFFLQTGGLIQFTDKSKLLFNDEILNNFLSGGKHQIAINHKLTIEELKQLQEKTIDYFIIGNIKSSIDRFEREYLRNVFIKIEKE